MALHVIAGITCVIHPEAWPWVLLVLVGNHAVLSGAVLWPRSSLLGANVVRLPERSARRGEVSLTFDDGPEPEITPRVLDLLDRYQMKASFFCVGRKVSARPEIVKEIARRGHSVENHSYHHSSAFAFYGLSRLAREIDAAQTTIADATGRLPGFFRAPAGFRSPMLDPVLARRGLHYVSWTRRAYDTVRSDPGAVLRKLTDGLAAGDVLLLHDGAHNTTTQGEPMVLAVLPALLERIRESGLKSVTLRTAFDNESRH